MITRRGARQLKSIVKHNRRSGLRGITKIYNEAKDQRVPTKTVSKTLHKMGFGLEGLVKSLWYLEPTSKKGVHYFTNTKAGELNNEKRSLFRRI